MSWYFGCWCVTQTIMFESMPCSCVIFWGCGGCARMGCTLVSSEPSGGHTRNSHTSTLRASRASENCVRMDKVWIGCFLAWTLQNSCRQVYESNWVRHCVIFQGNNVILATIKKMWINSFLKWISLDSQYIRPLSSSFQSSLFWGTFVAKCPERNGLSHPFSFNIQAQAWN